MNFLTQIDNLALIALLLVSGAALFLPTLSTLISGKGLSPTEATIWMNRRKAAVLDLRPESDFKLVICLEQNIFWPSKSLLESISSSWIARTLLFWFVILE
jgi:hypothetical protein